MLDEGGIGDGVLDGFGVGGGRDRVLFAAAEEEGDADVAEAVGREPREAAGVSRTRAQTRGAGVTGTGGGWWSGVSCGAAQGLPPARASAV